MRFDGNWFQRRIAHYVSSNINSYKSHRKRARAAEKAAGILSDKLSQAVRNTPENLVDKLNQANQAYDTLEANYGQAMRELDYANTRNQDLKSQLFTLTGERDLLEKEKDKYKKDYELQKGLIGHIESQLKSKRRAIRAIINMHPRAMLLIDGNGKVYAQNSRSRDLLDSQKLQDFTGRIDFKSEKKQEVQIGDYMYICRVAPLGEGEGYRVEVKGHLFKKKAKKKEEKIGTPKKQEPPIDMEEKLKAAKRTIKEFEIERGFTLDDSGNKP